MKISVKYIATKEIELNDFEINENKFDENSNYRDKILSKIERTIEKKDEDFYGIVGISNVETDEIIYEE